MPIPFDSSVGREALGAGRLRRSRLALFCFVRHFESLARHLEAVHGGDGLRRAGRSAAAACLSASAGHLLARLRRVEAYKP
jgi:hypothetical protein